jgi:hypothetical protein
MAKSPPKTEPGAKERFEQAIDYMLKTPPKKHETLAQTKKRRARRKKASAP